jgi:Tfp pilus assembly protein PilN
MSWLFSRFLYLDKTAAVLDKNGKELPEPALPGRYRTVLLSKHTYFETITEFPFSDLKEITDAIRLSPSDYAPFHTDLFFVRRIGRQPDKTRVNLWFVRPEACDIIRRAHPWFVFPETGLWATGSRNTARCLGLEKKDGTLMVHVDTDGAVRSTMTSPGRADSQSFLRGLGPQGQDCPVETFSDLETYIQALLATVSGAGPLVLAPFLQVRPVGGHGPLVRAGLKTLTGIALLLVLFFGIRAGMAVYVLQELKQTNQTLTRDLGDVLEKEAKIRAIENRIQALSGPIVSYLPRTALLNQLYDLLSGKDIVIRRLTVVGNRVELQGVSDRASALLDTLASVSGFQDVQLTQALKKDSRTGQDIFSISFHVVPEGPVEQ